jgi:hypothetical protein
MGNEKRELQKAFSVKEKNENLLTNLENLKSGGTLAENQYNAIKTGYTTSLIEAKTAIEQIKTGISQVIMAEEQNAQMLDMELKNISIRFQTGEMKVAESQKSQERIRKKIQQSRDNVTELKRLFNATSSSEVGGYIDTKPGTSFQPRSSSSGISFSGSGSVMSSIQGTSASDFTEFRTDVGEITGSIDQLIGLIGGIILFISIFLPWVSLFGFGVSLVSSSGVWALFGLILGIAAVAAAFLARENARGTLQLSVGVIAILFIVYNIVTSFGESSSFMGKYILQLLGIGFYLFAIGAVLLIIAGIIELKK